MRRRAVGLPTLGLLSALLAVPSAASGQRAVREVQIPFDSVRAILEVDADLRRELGLFAGVEGFQVARLFLLEDGRAVLEVESRQGGRLVRERRVLAVGDVGELRLRLAESLAAPERRTRRGDDERDGVILAETLLGLLFYGWALPTALDIHSARGYVGAYLLTAGASFYLPYRLTRDLEMTPAHRDALVWGGTRGIAYGALLGDLATLGRDDGNADDRAVLGSAMAGSLAGQVLAYQLVSAADADLGDVALWSAVSDLGLAAGFGTAVALGLYEGEEVCHLDSCSTSDGEATRAGHATTVLLGAASLWGAYRLSEAREYTVGNARALFSFGVLGGQALLPVAWAAFEDARHRERAVAGFLVAGGAAGLWVGDRVLRTSALSDTEGALVQAGHLAGGLAALGVTYLLDGSDDRNETLYMTTAAVGSTAGSLLTYRAVARRGGRGGGGGPRDASGLRLEVTPAGLLTGLLSGGGGVARRAAPLVTIRF